MSDPSSKPENPQRRTLLGGIAAAGVMAGMGVFRPVSAAEAAERTVNYRRPIPARGYAFTDFSGKLAPINFKRRALRSDDVAIDIRYCGICHSDVHTGLGHWWTPQPTPQVTGHEIAGIVTAVGKNVTRYKVGDRVGVGAFVDSCGHCKECVGQTEQYCENGATWTYGNPTSKELNPDGHTQGGYSDRIVVKERFVVKVPDGMPLEAAAPLMCAGVTSYSPFLQWKIGKGSNIAVVGLGGVGHTAVQIAKAMGADVTVFTTSPDKVADARRFGAKEVVVNYNEAQVKKLARSFDFIFAAVPVRFDMEPLFTTLKRQGTLCLIGAGKLSEPNQISPFTTPLQNVNFSGSLTGSVKEIQEMLNFCAEHRISPEIVLIRPDEIEARWKDVSNKKARYRYVIDMAKWA